MPKPATQPDNPSGRLVFATSSTKASLARQRKAGRAIRLAPGIYVVGGQLPAVDLARLHLWSIVNHVYPGAVVCDRSALAGGVDDGWLFLCHPDPPRISDLILPGIAVTCRRGLGVLPGDMPFIGLTMSGVARALLENVQTGGRPPHGRPPRAKGEGEVGDTIDALASSGHPGNVQLALTQLDQIADYFPTSSVAVVRRLLVAALGTVSPGRIASTRLAARIGGEPYDATRVDLFGRFRDELARLAPSIRIILGRPDRRRWLAFFEAYFSNYIEGTVFSPEEARRIAIDGLVPPGRPQDAHDVSATYRIVNDDLLMREQATDAQGFVELLGARHRVLMAARPEKRPGDFKQVPNYAGGTAFVAPPLVVGTLKAGWEILETIADPFHRAVFVMFVVTETHPFDDGNGRLARILTNAELVRAGQARVIVPTCYRANYLAALTAATVHGNASAIASALDFTRNWVSSLDWSSWESAIGDLTDTNAFLDAAVAESSGNRLRLPDGVRLGR